MSECKTCGRDDGHWLGCAKAATPDNRAQFITVEGFCILPGCAQPQRSADKRVKYCDAHSDPKNRK